MSDVEFFKEMVKVAEKQEDHLDFYALAEKYGFSAPWSEEVEACLIS